MNTYCEVNGEHVSEAKDSSKLAIDIKSYLAYYSANQGYGDFPVRVEVWEMGDSSYKGRHRLGQSLIIPGGLVGSKYRDFSKVAQGIARRAYSAA